MYLLTLFDLHFEQLVHGFFVVQCVHDREIDHPSQIDQIRLGPVLDTFLLRNGYAKLLDG